MEKREYERILLDVNVKYELESNNSRLYFTMRSVNMSRGGLCLKVNKCLEEGTQLNLRMIIPRLNRFIKSTARVKWSREFIKGRIYETGLQFSSIDEKFLDFIDSVTDSTVVSSEPTAKHA